MARGDARTRAEEVNELVDFAVAALQAAAAAEHVDAWRRTRRWGEFPEDLGRADLGIPASFWQREDVRALGAMGRRAIFQCNWAPVDYSKPPGIFTEVVGFWDGKVSYPGWPVFSEITRTLVLCPLVAPTRVTHPLRARTSPAHGEQAPRVLTPRRCACTSRSRCLPTSAPVSPRA